MGTYRGRANVDLAVLPRAMADVSGYLQLWAVCLSSLHFILSDGQPDRIRTRAMARISRRGSRAAGGARHRPLGCDCLCQLRILREALPAAEAALRREARRCLALRCRTVLQGFAEEAFQGSGSAAPGVTCFRQLPCRIADPCREPGFDHQPRDR